MNGKTKIAFFLMGEHVWIGGREYSENLIYALGKLSSKSKDTELCVISDSEISPHIKKYISKTYNKKNMKPVSFIERVEWELRSSFSTIGNADFYSFLKQEKIDFLYPDNNRDKLPKTCHSAAWIPDFQHKYLPDNFSDFKLMQLERKFSEITKTAKKIILSSKMAERDCHRY